MTRDSVSFHLIPAAAGVILQFAAGAVKGVTDRDMDVFVGMVQITLAADDDLIFRYRDVEAYVIEFALVVMVMPGLDDDPAAHYVVAELVEPFGPFTDVGFNGIGGFHVAQCNL